MYLCTHAPLGTNVVFFRLRARTRRIYLTVENERKNEREIERERDHKTDRLTKITAIGRHGAIRIRLFGELLFLVPSFVSDPLRETKVEEEKSGEFKRDRDTRGGRNDTSGRELEDSGKEGERRRGSNTRENERSALQRLVHLAARESRRNGARKNGGPLETLSSPLLQSTAQLLRTGGRFSQPWLDRKRGPTVAAIRKRGHQSRPIPITPIIFAQRSIFLPSPLERVHTCVY